MWPPRIRFHLAWILFVHWAAFRERHRGTIRGVVHETVRKIVSCRTPALGCHVYQCPGCGDVRLVPHSCKSRSCPTCGKHATDVWADGVLNDLLDVPYHHLVLAVPWQLRSTLLLNRRVGFNVLFRAALLSVQDWAAKVHGMRMGVVAVLHTFGADLKFHPHVHLLVTGGGLSLDGRRWISTDPRFLMYHGGLKDRWRYHVVRLLRAAHKAGEIRFSGSSSFLQDYPLFNSMLQKLYQVTWYAHIGTSLLDPRFTVRYIGRYTKRAVLAEYRITHYDGKTVRFSYRDYAHGGKVSYKTLPVLAFLERLVRHVPDKHFPMVRHAGLFATRWKARYLAQAREALRRTGRGGAAEPTSPPDPGDRRGLLDWRARQQLATGHDPLRCPRCDLEMNLLGTLFGRYEEVARLFDEVGQPRFPYAPTGTDPAWPPW